MCCQHFGGRRLAASISSTKLPDNIFHHIWRPENSATALRHSNGSRQRRWIHRSATTKMVSSRVTFVSSSLSKGHFAY